MRQYDFDQYIERRGTNSVKWDNVGRQRGNPDALPMWVADSDFACADPIVEAVRKRAQNPAYGYSFVPPAFYSATAGWLERHHHWKIEEEWVIYSPGVVPGICAAIRGLSEPGQKIIIQSPVYHPFAAGILDNGRQVSNNPLIFCEDHYEVDFEDLEEKAADPEARVLLLCSPHNPVGKVFTPEELRRMADICLRHGLALISDEIHSDLILPGYTHYSVGALDERYLTCTVSCFSPSKTFNIAGFKASGLVIPDPKLRAAVQEELVRAHVTSPTVFSMEAYVAAFEQCDDYLEQQMQYIMANMEHLDRRLKEEMPAIRLIPPQGTYLAWLDCRVLGMTPEDLNDFFTNRCGVAINRGDMFGQGGEGFIRVNVACPRMLLDKALDLVLEQYRQLNL